MWWNTPETVRRSRSLKPSAEFDVNRTTDIFAILMVDGVVACKHTAQEHDRLPFTALQMYAGLDSLCENPIRRDFGQIFDH